MIIKTLMAISTIIFLMMRVKSSNVYTVFCKNNFSRTSAGPKIDYEGTKNNGSVRIDATIEKMQVGSLQFHIVLWDQTRGGQMLRKKTLQKYREKNIFVE